MSKIIEIKSKAAGYAGNILHKVVKLNIDDEVGRVDLSDMPQPLQAAYVKTEPDTEFPAHRHIIKEQSDKAFTQEAWVIIQGAVEISYYDVDDAFLESHIINPGDCSITFEGGHSYRVLSDGVQAYEFKSGPYNGREKDKVFI